MLRIALYGYSMFNDFVGLVYNVDYIYLPRVQAHDGLHRYGYNFKWTV